MNEHEENRSERVFEVFWRQHNPDDWMADVVDVVTGERRRVYSLDELAAIIAPPFPHKLTGSLDPGSGR
jgi:peptide methionine sulfoxide reductase MsrA